MSGRPLPAPDWVCGTCHFWLEHGPEIDGSEGQCQRYPPRLFLERGKYGLWPFTKRRDRCGEWMLRAEWGRIGPVSEDTK